MHADKINSKQRLKNTSLVTGLAQRFFFFNEVMSSEFPLPRLANRSIVLGPWLSKSTYLPKINNGSKSDIGSELMTIQSQGLKRGLKRVEGLVPDSVWMAVSSDWSCSLHNDLFHLSDLWSLLSRVLTCCICRLILVLQDLKSISCHCSLQSGLQALDRMCIMCIIIAWLLTKWTDYEYPKGILYTVWVYTDGQILSTKVATLNSN